MMILVYLFFFLFGLAVGSFLNCLIYRLETGKSFFKGRSFCPHCQHILGWQDLIPILSFLILKGKCRYCHQKISWQYPLVELATALIFPLIFITRINIWTGVYLLIITSFLIIIFVYDLKHYIIPDKVIYPAIGIAVLYQLFGIWPPTKILWAVGFGILPSVFFLAIILFSHERWMGFGDFKLVVLMGLILGFPNILVALFLAFFLGAIIGMGLVISGKKQLSSEVPFGPFLVTGTFFALFFGKEIINWYLNLF
jgi:prepilin signal peptidase PulO-like enzyme (type II secretory pathway)